MHPLPRKVFDELPAWKFDMAETIQPPIKLSDCLRHNANRRDSSGLNGAQAPAPDAEFSLLWPPCAQEGAPTVVEAHLGISQTSCVSPGSLPSSPAREGSAGSQEQAGRAAMEHALSMQLGGGLRHGSLLTVLHDTVVDATEFKLPPRGETAVR